MAETPQGKTEVITSGISSYFDYDTKIQVSFEKKTGQKVTYNSTIIDKDADSIYITMPMKGGIPVNIPKGTPLSVSAFSPKGQVNFETCISGINRSKVLAYALEMPSKIILIQLRKFFRVETDILAYVYPMSIQELEKTLRTAIFDAPEPVEAVVLDLSGGGCKISTSLNIEVKTNLVLDFAHSVLDDVGKVDCTAVRCVPSEDKFLVSVSFLNLTPLKQDKLVNYVFKRQIELKKERKVSIRR